MREPNSPCSDQSDKSIKRWLRSNIKVDAIVAIRQMQNGMLRYERATVRSVRPKNFNVSPQRRDGTFDESTITFDYAGRHWREPAGQTRLVVPTPTVLEACDLCDFGSKFLPGKPGRYICR
jgi:hypothetical protein